MQKIITRNHPAEINGLGMAGIFMSGKLIKRPATNIVKPR